MLYLLYGKYTEEMVKDNLFFTSVCNDVMKEFNNLVGKFVTPTSPFDVAKRN